MSSPIRGDSMQHPRMTTCFRRLPEALGRVHDAIGRRTGTRTARAGLRAAGSHYRAFTSGLSSSSRFSPISFTSFRSSTERFLYGRPSMIRSDSYKPRRPRAKRPRYFGDAGAKIGDQINSFESLRVPSTATREQPSPPGRSPEQGSISPTAVLLKVLTDKPLKVDHRSWARFEEKSQVVDITAHHTQEAHPAEKVEARVLRRRPISRDAHGQAQPLRREPGEGEHAVRIHGRRLRVPFPIASGQDPRVTRDRRAVRKDEPARNLVAGLHLEVAQIDQRAVLIGPQRPRRYGTLSPSGFP